MSRVSHETHHVNQQIAHSERHAKGLHQERHMVEEKARVVVASSEGDKLVRKTIAKTRTEKDVMLSASKQMKTEKQEKLEIEKSSDDMILKYLSQEEESTIAILGKMAALIAQADSTFRQTLWNQSTQTMQMTISMAPMLKDLVTSQWDEQAKATEEDAAKEQGSGIGMLIGSGVGIAMGGMAAKTEEGEEALKSGEDGANLKNNNAEEAVEKDAANAEEKVEDNAAKQPKADPKASATKGWSMKRIGKYMKHIMGGVQTSQIMSQGGVQLANDAPHDRAKADHQRTAGQYDGASKEMEGYQAWGNQITERSNQGVSSADQNHASTIQTWKSSSDSLTNSLVSAWNKI